MHDGQAARDIAETAEVFFPQVTELLRSWCDEVQKNLLVRVSGGQ